MAELLKKDIIIMVRHKFCGKLQSLPYVEKYLLDPGRKELEAALIDDNYLVTEITWTEYLKIDKTLLETCKCFKNKTT